MEMERAATQGNRSLDTLIQRVEFACNTVNHVLIGFVTIYLTWVFIHYGMTVTGWHGIFCVLGYNLLMAEAIMSHYKGNVLTYSYSRKTKTTIHWVMMTIGGVLGIVGTVIKICNKTEHFKTLHGQLGLASLILCCISLITGLTALYAGSLKQYCKPLFNKSFHNLLGLATFAISMMSMYYAYDTGFIRRKTSEDFQTMMKVFTVLIIIFSCYNPLKSLVEKWIVIFNNM